MSNVHSPFEPGYIGNSDGGAVAVLDATFDAASLIAAGATDQEVSEISAQFEALDDPAHRIAAASLLDDETSAASVLENFRLYQQQVTAYDALPEADRAALEALSDEARAALAALTEEDRALLAGEAGPAAGAEGGTTDVPTGSVDEVLAWVGNDRGRAETALAVEETRDKPRAGVVTPLTRLLSGETKPTE